MTTPVDPGLRVELTKSVGIPGTGIYYRDDKFLPGRPITSRRPGIVENAIAAILRPVTGPTPVP